MIAPDFLGVSLTEHLEECPRSAESGSVPEILRTKPVSNLVNLR